MSFMKKAIVSACYLIIFLWVATGLFVALASPVAALVLKLLVPEWLFVALIVIAIVPTRQDTWIPQLVSSLSLFSPRPPPIH